MGLFFSRKAREARKKKSEDGGVILEGEGNHLVSFLCYKVMTSVSFGKSLLLTAPLINAL